AALDENYKPLSPTVRRTVGETFQKILFGGADRPLSDIAELAAVNYAREHGIEVRDVPGTLRGGRIGVEDVKKYERQ
ncbi:MAG TPA: E3 binding domain-containing protein, partial [Anaerolineae bacterium]|nr:E3 binding domain-containing protein [Anaerolineae bacterium]